MASKNKIIDIIKNFSEKGKMINEFEEEETTYTLSETDLMELQHQLEILEGFPEGIELDKTYQLDCDDKGYSGANWLRVYISKDADVNLIMQDWEDIEEEGSVPSLTPSLRCRNSLGGGRNNRTYSALLNLAQAIHLDNEDNNKPTIKKKKSP